MFTVVECKSCHEQFWMDCFVGDLFELSHDYVCTACKATNYGPTDRNQREYNARGDQLTGKSIIKYFPLENFWKVLIIVGLWFPLLPVA